jgi:flagellar export protein FliJ
MRSVWSVLLSKSEKEVKIARQKLADVQQTKTAAEERRDKLDQLLIEYTDQLKAVQLRSHNTAEVGNFQQFISQLQSMRVKSKHEMEILKTNFEAARKHMLRLEHERLKIEMLEQREREKFEMEALARETREIESSALQQFNFKERIQQT